jgi:hypothetical protein
MPAERSSGQTLEDNRLHPRDPVGRLRASLGDAEPGSLGTVLTIGLDPRDGRAVYVQLVASLLPLRRGVQWVCSRAVRDGWIEIAAPDRCPQAVSAAGSDTDHGTSVCSPGMQ